MAGVTLGVERLAADPPAYLRHRRLALLCNHASVDRAYRHSRDLVDRVFPGQLTCLLSPQHGFYAEEQDNMEESDHTVDPATGLPVYSLYGDSRRPTAAMLERFDALLVDLQDVGTRVYTFIATLAWCMEECAAHGKQVVVLDRPNPVGGEILEGPSVAPGFESFVGLFPIPLRHGCTMGEIARLYNTVFGIGADLEVVAMTGWQRRMYWADTGLPWVYPSPNMPSATTALVYPGQVLWEGTNVSEGRGTTLPFELCGAPWWEAEHIAAAVAATPGGLDGCLLRPVLFKPTANKYRGEICRGFHLHVTDPHGFRPLRLSLALLAAVIQHPAFHLKEPGYEYDFQRCPLDLILGTDQVRRSLADGATVADLEAGWQDDLALFAEIRRPLLLYP